MLDGFSGYNQIMVSQADQDKTTFTTPWGTLMYAKMPFGLTNAGATFQMDLVFVGKTFEFTVIYLDYLIVFYDSDENHLKHLSKVFHMCRKYGMSINPKT